jgi:hypothetical protein
MNRRVVLAALGSLLACGAPAWGASSYPMIMGIKPVAIQVGTSAELTVQARYSLDGSYRVLVSGTGVAGEVTDSRSTPAVASNSKKRGPTVKKAKRNAALVSIKVRFRAEKDALPGIRDIRLAGPYGASTVGQLLVVQDPVIAEAADNDSLDKAQRITLPAAVCGAIESIEDRDYFKFHVEAGQSLVFRVRGMLLENRIHDMQSHLDPIITLRSPTGATIAVGDNDISGDPLLCQRFDRADDYTLEIRDVRYKGDRDWVYCVEINDRPFVRTVYPLAVTAGRHVSLEPAGLHIPRGAKIDWNVPATWAVGFHEAQLPLAGKLTNPVSLVVTDLPTVFESANSHDTAQTAQPVSAPVGINGRIQKEGELDVYSFPAKQGETFTFESVSRREGSPLDSVLRLLDAKGRTLGEGDDQSDFGRTSADGIIENWRAPADGTYAVEIGDLLQRGGPAFVYVLKITRPEPEFHLFLDTDKTELAPGTSGVIFVNSVRKYGFAGEIALAVAGLPEGVTAFCDRIPANHRDGCIILTASPDAKPAVSNIIVTGSGRQPRPTGSPQTLHAIARPLQETYVPGGGRGHWPVEAHAVAVGLPGDILAVKLSRHELSLAPGESARVDVDIVRAAGFTDNVTLNPRFDHLGQVFGDTLPTGVVIDDKHSKTLLTAKETHGYLMFRALPTVEPATKRPVSVMANVAINFVMKATYSSRPLFVTTAPKPLHSAKK